MLPKKSKVPFSTTGLCCYPLLSHDCLAQPHPRSTKDAAELNTCTGTSAQSDMLANISTAKVKK